MMSINLNLQSVCVLSGIISKALQFICLDKLQPFLAKPANSVPSPADSHWLSHQKTYKPLPAERTVSYRHYIKVNFKKPFLVGK